MGLVLSSALAVAACAVIDPVDTRYDTISRSLTKARNEAIVLNLVRASHNYPLDFVTIANVTPTLTNTTTLGLPSFLLGPHVSTYGAPGSNVGAPLFSPGRDIIFGNTTASNATAISTNFSVSTQETSSFYEGFLKPIDLEVADYFIRQNYSRELLFWLFVDRVEIDLPNHQSIGSRFDPPKEYGCNPPKADPKERCFPDYVLLAIGAGLTVEEKTVQDTSGGAKAPSTSPNSGPSKPPTTISSRLCFDPVLAVHAQAEMTQDGKPWADVQKKFADFPITFSPRCGDKSWDPRKTAKDPQPDYFPFQVGNIVFKIFPRSAYGVFEFLGNLIKIKQEQITPPVGQLVPYIPKEREQELAQEPMLWLSQNPTDHSLITIAKGATNTNCFAHTWFEDGDYCIPDNAETAKTVIALLAQLIAIQTSATDLSITPLVRVVQ